MKKFLFVVLMVICIAGCKKTEVLERHDAVVLDWRENTPREQGQCRYDLVYKDLTTGDVVSAGRNRLPPPIGTHFKVDKWVPLVEENK